MFYACNSIDQVLVNRFSGFSAVSGRKSPFPITLAIGLHNSNNNNNNDTVYGAVIMAEPLREFTGFILMNVEWRQAAADPRPSQTT